MRSLFAIFATSFILITASASAADRVPVATINGTTIWFDEIMAIAETLPAEYQRAGLENIYGQLVSEMANSHLAAAAGKEAGLAEDARIAEAMKLASDRILAEAYIRREVEALITDEAIASAYDAFVADTASREQVTASHILVESEAEAIAIIEQLTNGTDFAELAREKSTGPSAPNGGSLGSFGRGQMVPAFETAAFGMPIGSFSATPVQTQFGWHVIQIAERSVTPAPELDAMRDQLVTNLSRQSFARIIEILRADAEISIRDLKDVLVEAEAAAKE